MILPTDRGFQLFNQKTFYCGYPYENKSKNLVLPPRRALFGQPVQKYPIFFALIKKIFLQTLGEIIFRYHEKYF